nr:MAG TPA: hypothetical protein [Caudoviricetes sp.]
MVSTVTGNVTTCCGKFRNKLIVLHNIKDRCLLRRYKYSVFAIIYQIKT